MFIYVYARPNTMTGHDFTDDVALCKAWTLKGAIKKFSKYYSDCADYVHRMRRFHKRHCSNVIILTDY